MSFAAILSASKAVAGPTGQPRGTLHFAGQTLVEYQARQAARAGATSVVIMVSIVTAELSRAVDRLGADGIEVQLIRDVVTLVREGPRDGDVLLVGDGVVVAQHHVDAVAALPGNVLLVTDDSHASATLDRIDAGQRWAGLLRLAPETLYATLDMIGEWDLELTLVRAAVQAGARRVTAPQDDPMEGRVALVDGQVQADLVARAMMQDGGGTRADISGGAERYLLAPPARALAPLLMRAQVPATQVRIGGIVLAAIALVPIELDWIGMGLFLALAALLVQQVADRLDTLSLRTPPVGAMAFATPVLALLAIVRGWPGETALFLALMLAIVLLADRWGRAGDTRGWMRFTPGSAVLLLMIGQLLGVGTAALSLAMLCAIASLAAIVLRRVAA